MIEHGRILDRFNPANMLVIDTKIHGYRIKSLRRCPACRTDLHTNGKGHFKCMVCGYEDNKDVSKLGALGYRSDHRKHARMLSFKSDSQFKY